MHSAVKAAGWLLIVLVVFAVGIGLGVRFSDQWTPAPVTQESANAVSFAVIPTPLITIPPFSLTPAPPGETPLQRWRRTKADYERALDVDTDAVRQVQQATLDIAAEPYTDAEKALANEGAK
jgi:hypothetical protein